MNWWIDKWIDKLWIDGWTGKRIYDLKDGWINGCLDRWIRWTDRWVDGCLFAWIDRWMDKWMAKCIEKLMDGRNVDVRIDGFDIDNLIEDRFR